MSSLGLSVLLLAAIAIAVVVGYNFWLMRRLGVGRAREVAREDAVAPAERGEPSLGLDASEVPADDAPRAEPARGGFAEAQSVMDPRTDCIVEIELTGAIAAERLAMLGNRLRRVGSKPVILEVGAAVDWPVGGGQAMQPDEYTEEAVAQSEDWRAPEPGRHYQRVRLGVLLANRSGSLNAMEFSDFAAGVQQIADQLNGFVDTPPMHEVLARAKALDELCESLDAQVGLGVQAEEALGVQDLSLLALEADCVERGNNRYARVGDGGEVIFSLALADEQDRLSLLLDVPRAPASLSPWDEMLACARLCAERLGGRLVDDSGASLAEDHLAAIALQIAQRHRALEEAGFPAGSALSLRLFN